MDCESAAGWHRLFQDTDGDCRFTVTDLGHWAQHVFFLPGDSLLSAVLKHAPAVARFLELTPDDYGGAFPGVLSTLVWLSATLALLTFATAVRNLDRLLTAYVLSFHAEARRRVLMTKIRFTTRVHRLMERYARRERGMEESSIQVAEVPPLNETELAILEWHATLSPGCMATAREIAAGLELPAHEAEHALAKLTEMQLLQTGFGLVDGEVTYHLSRPGHVFLRARK